MKISKITAANFKGKTFSNELKPITVFVGDNFTGKSSRTESLALALAGYIPGIERKPGSILDRMGSSDMMRVRADFDNGSFIQREYKGTAKGAAVSASHRGLSDSFAVDASLIDSTEFLGLSSAARVKFLFNRLTIQGEVLTPSVLLAQIKPEGEDAAKFVSDIEAEVATDHEQAMTNGLSPQAFVESMLATYSERKKQSVEKVGTLMKSQSAMTGSSVEGPVLSREQAQEALNSAQNGVKVASEALNSLKTARATEKPAVDDDKEQSSVSRLIGLQDAAKRMLAEAEQELEEAAGLDCCPKCGAKKAGWRQKIEDAAKEVVVECKQRVVSGKASLDKAKSVLQKRREEIKAAEEKLAKKFDKKILAAVDALDKANELHSKAQVEMNKVIARETEEKQRQKAAALMKSVSVQAEVLKQFCKILQASLDSCIKNSIEPLVTKINALCEGILPAPIAYVNGELGMSRDKFSAWKSFSGTEKALFLCAVSIALASESDIKLVVLDEIGRLDEQNKLKVVQRLMELTHGGEVDQAILIDAGHAEWWQSQFSEDDLAVIEVK